VQANQQVTFVTHGDDDVRSSPHELADNLHRWYPHFTHTPDRQALAV
jgi:hypothetical protein